MPEAVNLAEARMQAEQAEIAQQVREAIAHVPPLQGTMLEVDEQNIYASSVGNQHWWRVPLTPHPHPVRLSPLYEIMAEIEEYLPTEQHNDIILFVGDFIDEKPVSAERDTSIRWKREFS